jgi:hypothetical protein
VRTLTDDAVARVAAAGGNGEGARDDIAETFEAASLDEDVARDLVGGRLTRTARAPVGFGLLGMGSPPGDAAGAAPLAEPAEPAESTRTADDRRQARARARDARAAADEAREVVTERREAVRRSEVELERVQRELDEARDALHAAETDASRADAEADAAEAEATAAS